MAIWLTADHEERYPGARAAIFRARAAFEARLGLTPPHEASRQAQDVFDDAPNAVHVVEFVRDEVSFCFRLLPTIGPTLLKTVHAHLLGDAPAPAALDIWEWSGWAYSAPEGAESQCPGARLRRLHIAALELFAGLRLSAVSAQIDPLFITSLSQIGYQVAPLALPGRHNGRPLVPVLLTMNDETLDKARAHFNLLGAVLELGVLRPPPAPALYA